MAGTHDMSDANPIQSTPVELLPGSTSSSRLSSGVVDGVQAEASTMPDAPQCATPVSIGAAGNEMPETPPTPDSYHSATATTEQDPSEEVAGRLSHPIVVFGATSTIPTCTVSVSSGLFNTNCDTSTSVSTRTSTASTTTTASSLDQHPMIVASSDTSQTPSVRTGTSWSSSSQLAGVVSSCSARSTICSTSSTTLPEAVMATAGFSLSGESNIFSAASAGFITPPMTPDKNKRTHNQTTTPVFSSISGPSTSQSCVPPLKPVSCNVFSVAQSPTKRKIAVPASKLSSGRNSLTGSPGGRGSGNATPCGGVSPGGGFLSPTTGNIAPSQDAPSGPPTSGSIPRSRGCEKNLTKTFEAVTAAAAAAAAAASADENGASGVNKHHNLFLQLSQQNNHAFQVAALQAAAAVDKDAPPPPPSSSSSNTSSAACFFPPSSFVSDSGFSSPSLSKSAFTPTAKTATLKSIPSSQPLTYSSAPHQVRAPPPPVTSLQQQTSHAQSLATFQQQAQAFQMQHLKSLEAQRLQQIHAPPSVPQLHHHPPAPPLQLQQQLHHLTPQVQAPVRAAANLPASANGYQHLNFHPPPPPSAFMTVSSAGTGSQLDATASGIFSSPPLPHPQMGGGPGPHSSLSAPLGFAGNAHSQHHHPPNAVSTAGSFKAQVHGRQNKGSQRQLEKRQVDPAVPAHSGQDVCHGHHIDEHFQRQLPRPQGVDSDADASASDEDESGSASGSTVSGSNTGSTSSAGKDDAVTSSREGGANGKYCDCCYCELFGHNNPQQAPTSKNFQEMRDRLRLRLSAKKRNSAASESSTATSRVQQQQQQQHHNVDNHAQMTAGMNYGNWHDMGGVGDFGAPASNFFENSTDPHHAAMSASSHAHSLSNSSTHSHAPHHLPMPQTQSTANYHHLPPPDWHPSPTIRGQQYPMPGGQLHPQPPLPPQQQNQHQQPQQQLQQQPFPSTAMGQTDSSYAAPIKTNEDGSKAKQNQRLVQAFSNLQVKDAAPPKESSPSIGVMDVDTIVKYINGDLEEEERASRKAEKRRRQKEKKLEEQRKKEEEEERQRREEERKRKEEEERKRREEEKRKREEEQERKRKEEEERKRKLEEEMKRKEEEDRRSKNAGKKKNKKGGNKTTFEEETFANEISQLEKQMSEMLAAAKKRSKKSSSGSSASPPEPTSSAKPTPDREILENANQVLVLRNEKMKEQIVRTMIANDDEEKVFLGDWKNTMKVECRNDVLEAQVISGLSGVGFAPRRKYKGPGQALVRKSNDTSQANPNDIVEGVLTKALSGGKAKREKAARKAEARKQEASATLSDGINDSQAKPDADKSDEVMEKLYKSLKEAEAHGLLQGLGKEMMREFAKEIAATTAPATAKSDGETTATKGAKQQPTQQIKQQQQQQQPSSEEAESSQGKSKKKKKSSVSNTINPDNNDNSNDKKKTQNSENLASQKSQNLSTAPTGSQSNLSKENQRYTNGNPITSKPQTTTQQQVPKKDTQADPKTANGGMNDLAAGLFKGLSGLLPGLDAAKLLQQQQSATADPQSSGKSFLNCNGGDWVVGTERFPPSKAPNAASPLTAKLDAMQLLMELNKKSNLKDMSADQLRSVSEQLGKVLPATTQQQQQPHQPTSQSRPTNGNVPHGGGSVVNAGNQSGPRTQGAVTPQGSQQQQHSTTIGINGRKIAVPVKKGKNPTTPPAPPTTSVGNGTNNVNNGPSATSQQQQQPQPQQQHQQQQQNGTQQRNATAAVSAAKNAKTSNGGSSINSNYNNNGNLNNNNNAPTGGSAKVTKMLPTSIESTVPTTSVAKISVSNPVASSTFAPSKVATVASNNNINNNNKSAASLTNGNPVVAKQQNGNAASAVASKEKPLQQQPQQQQTQTATSGSSTAAVASKPRVNQAVAAIHQTKLSSAVTTQQRSVSVGRGTSAAATKTTATSTTSLPVPPNSPSRHARNAAPVNGSVNIAANIAASRRKQRKKNKNPDDAASIDDIFLPKDDTELELGDLDEFERELETFKRFCANSTPAVKKEKVNFNLKDIIVGQNSSKNVPTRASEF